MRRGSSTSFIIFFLLSLSQLENTLVVATIESFVMMAALVGAGVALQPFPSGHLRTSMRLLLPLSRSPALCGTPHIALTPTLKLKDGGTNVAYECRKIHVSKRFSTFPTAFKPAPRDVNTISANLRIHESEDRSSEDTIFALSTGNAGPAGVAVIRISGNNASNVLQAITAAPSMERGSKGVSGAIRKERALPPPRHAVVRRLYDPANGDLLDEALVLWMPGPRSFTGEDTVELHTHGSRAVINGVLDALGSMAPSGVRMAERGEFTQRAYGNGRMDLTGVEGLADLLAADTSAQRKQALRQMGGALRDMYESWREELKVCLAHAEAVIDFGDDEEDVGGDAAFASIFPKVAKLAAEMKVHLRDGRRGEIVRSGVRVAIVGPPNAGKSSLLNILASRPAAIVSPVAGTTRDVVQVQMDLAGLPVTLSDTAGLREATEDEIEREGMRRAREAISNAQLVIFVFDGADGGGAMELLRTLREESGVETAEAADGHRERVGENKCFSGTDDTPAALDHVITVANKADLPQAEGRIDDTLNALAGAAAYAGSSGPRQTAGAAFGESQQGEGTDGDLQEKPTRIWRISCRTRQGVDDFVNHLEEEVAARFQISGDDESPLITRRRHREHVEACLVALQASQEASLPLDLAAEELRIASCELGRITGAVGVEELLDVIFRDFCIGK